MLFVEAFCICVLIDSFRLRFIVLIMLFYRADNFFSREFSCCFPRRKHGSWLLFGRVCPLSAGFCKTIHSLASLDFART
jgi:hypothetical protein